MAGHKDDTATLRHLFSCQAGQAQLGVAVEHHSVVVGHAGFHTARGVENEVVQGAEVLDGSLYQGCGVLSLGHVPLYGNGLTTGFFNGGDNLGSAGCLGAVVDDDVSSLGGKNLGGICAHAAGGTGNNNGLVLK